MSALRTVGRAIGFPRASVLAAAALCLALGIVSSPAHARQEYNDAILAGMTELLEAEGRFLPCPRANNCIMCHEAPEGGGTFGQPFFTAISTAGFVITTPSTAKDALAKLREDMVDTNGDMVIDFEHLALHENPNPMAADPETGRTPPPRVASCTGATYGCGGRIAAPPPSHRAPQLALVALAFCAAGVGARRLRRAAASD